jgi:hypothetical protein
MKDALKEGLKLANMAQRSSWWTVCWFLLMHVQDYLKSMQCGGLILVDEQETKLVVNCFAKLVPDGIYTYPLISKEAFARVLGEVRHLQQSREDEFARALTDYLQHAEPDEVRVQGIA